MIIFDDVPASTSFLRRNKDHSSILIICIFLSLDHLPRHQEQITHLHL